jgi:hypothetical protein
MIRTAFPLAAALVVVLAAACNDDAARDVVATATLGSLASPTAPTTPTAAPVPTSTPVSEPSGITTVDRIIRAVQTEDYETLDALLQYRPVPCVTEVEGFGAPPECLEGEEEGTLVNVFAGAQCHGWFARPDDYDVTNFPLRGARLYAVYETGPNHFPEGDYAIIFEGGGRDERPDGIAWQFVADDVGITGVHHGCGMTPAAMVEFQRLEVALVPPRER